MDNLSRLKELSKFIDDSEKVLNTITSPGWVEIIGPLLDKMIIDVLGSKQNNRWHNGHLGNKELGESKLQILCAYKEALTDLHSYIYDFVDRLEPSKAEYTELVKEETSEPTEMKSSYAFETEEKISG